MDGINRTYVHNALSHRLRCHCKGASPSFMLSSDMMWLPTCSHWSGGVCFLLWCRPSEWLAVPCTEAGDVSPQPGYCVVVAVI